MNSGKQVLLFSTLNPYPFWAGSENFWYDLVLDKRINSSWQFHIMLADSPVTRGKAVQLNAAGIKTSFYPHFNNSFIPRNFYRIIDKVRRRSVRTFPWYRAITQEKNSLVIFSVSTHIDLIDLNYAVQLCRKSDTPYWIILQHGYEDFFLTTQKDFDTVIDTATSAKRFIFISQRNRTVLERAIGQKLDNAFHSVNALSSDKIKDAFRFSVSDPVSTSGTARFFNLGRFAPKDKAQYLLLECFADRRWKERDWQLNFIGVSGFGKEYLTKLIRYYGLDKEKIKTMKHTENVFAEIVRNDVLMMPSMSEGTPFAMVESMACGRPAIGTPVGGIPELIEDGKNGWLSRTVAVDDIREKLEQAWVQRSEWKQMGEDARSFIQNNYNQENSFPALIELLHKDASL